MRRMIRRWRLILYAMGVFLGFMIGLTLYYVWERWPQ